MHAFPFGKFRGQTAAEILAADPGYLQWALKTDIPQRYPELGAEIKDALENGLDAIIPPLDQVEITPDDLPSLSATVRGGGSMCDGVSHVVRLFLDGAGLVTRYLAPSWDNRSRSGKSGDFGFAKPTADGVYQLLGESGSIANARAWSAYYLLRDGEWYRVKGGKLEVIALLRDLQAR